LKGLLYFSILRESGEMFLDICPQNKRDKPMLEALIKKGYILGLAS
jgi:hypothetical protein